MERIYFPESIILMSVILAIMLLTITQQLYNIPTSKIIIYHKQLRDT